MHITYLTLNAEEGHNGQGRDHFWEILHLGIVLASVGGFPRTFKWNSRKHWEKSLHIHAMPSPGDGQLDTFFLFWSTNCRMIQTRSYLHIGICENKYITICLSISFFPSTIKRTLCPKLWHKLTESAMKIVKQTAHVCLSVCLCFGLTGRRLFVCVRWFWGNSRLGQPA